MDISNILPTRVGLRGLYVLSDMDCQQIREKRLIAGRGAASGNDPHERQVYPAIVVADWADWQNKPAWDAGKYNTVDGRVVTWEEHVAGMTVNVQVFLDGNDVYWATSRRVENIDGFEGDPRGHFLVGITEA